jgi:hypothetical protein
MTTIFVLRVREICFWLKSQRERHNDGNADMVPYTHILPYSISELG